MSRAVQHTRIKDIDVITIGQLSPFASEQACRLGFQPSTPARNATLVVWLPLLVKGEHGDTRQLAEKLGVPYPTLASWVAGSGSGRMAFHPTAVRRHRRVTEKVLIRAFGHPRARLVGAA
jgi:hypothetical protein